MRDDQNQELRDALNAPSLLHKEGRQRVFKSLEIAEQQGVSYVGELKHTPGRVPLMPLTLLQMLIATLGFSLALFYFTSRAEHYLMPLAVVQIIFFSQTALYHSSFRALRKGLALFHALFTVAFSALVIWAFWDRMTAHAELGGQYLLIASMVLIGIIPFLMLAHWTYLGRSYRIAKR